MNHSPTHKRRTSQETREAVLAAARRLFFTKGFDQTTLMDLGEETGLSARGVILHFETKADIIATLLISFAPLLPKQGG